MRVKGKDQPVAIYEIIDPETDKAGTLKQAAISRFDEAVTLYRNQEFPAALAAFETILAANPQDGPAGIYIDRCRRLIADGWDAARWDGVETIETK